MAKKRPIKKCGWAWDDDGFWQTGCGGSWAFLEDGPRENGVNFCHGCGNPIFIIGKPKGA